MKTSTKIILLAIVIYLVAKRSQEKPGSVASQPTHVAASPVPSTTQQQAAATPAVTEHAGGYVITYNGKTYYTGGPIGKTVYDDMAAERAKYNSCPTHGTSTMRHVHTYNQGHVEDYYQCTVCGHRNTVYVK